MAWVHGYPSIRTLTKGLVNGRIRTVEIYQLEHAMLVYKSVYKWEEGVCLGEVLDFPGTVAAGATLDQARANLASALSDMAETNLLRGEPLPLPNPALTDACSELEEPIYLLLRAGWKLTQDVTVSSP
jgi:predicted RNase H-like HicB family nuclease